MLACIPPETLKHQNRTLHKFCEFAILQHRIITAMQAQENVCL